MMDFYIRQNATLPYLKVKVFKDGRNDYKEFSNSLTASTITFSMYDEETQVYRVLDRPASIIILHQIITCITNLEKPTPKRVEDILVSLKL